MRPRTELTTREEDVARLLVRGWKVREVADYLGISPKTADTHKTNLMKTLGVHNRADLVTWAIATGSLTVEDAKRRYATIQADQAAPAVGTATNEKDDRATSAA